MSRRLTYPGACHCGNVELWLESDKTPAELGVRTDTCSFCVKHQALYTSDPGGEIAITIRQDQQVERYRFGTRTADFLLCQVCGVFVAAYVPEAALAVVNVNVLQSRDAFMTGQVQLADLDGESLAQRIARRKAKWTPVRSIVGGGDPRS